MENCLRNKSQRVLKISDWYRFTLLVTSMMNFQFLKHLFSITSVNVQKQSFTVVLQKPAPKSVTNFSRKHLYQALLFYKVANSIYATYKYDSGKDVFMWNVRNFLKQSLYNQFFETIYYVKIKQVTLTLLASAVLILSQ